MIVLGADTHKSSHTIAAVDTATGQVLGDKTIAVGSGGFAALVLWARGFDGERVWALEDCRHVSGALERFLIARGERVVRVSTRLMAGTRRSSRERGKSDQIDATSVARAALTAGIATLPTAALAGPELDLRLLVDHRERLVRARVALNSTLQWNLHDVWPELTLPGGALFSKKRTTKIALARAAGIAPILDHRLGEGASARAVAGARRPRGRHAIRHRRSPVPSQMKNETSVFTRAWGVGE
jgi:transposase